VFGGVFVASAGSRNDPNPNVTRPKVERIQIAR
jgi:hypothetical protein